MQSPKRAAEHIAQYIEIIYNTSIKTGAIPSDEIVGNNWKQHKTHGRLLFNLLIHRSIKSQNDIEILQKDRTGLERWSISWKLSFNPRNDKTVTHNIRKRIERPYFLHGTILEVEEHYPYVGLELDSKLNWNHHTTSKMNKAYHNKLIFLKNCIDSHQISNNIYNTAVQYGTLIGRSTLKR
ncbi:unnamed protein product [Mytilus coruscus]|uniref:Uncharacterized protein n=1 Tax=Mytilus coruscus TaxID=42192 RepID=A0A6J8EWP2_MYTCO|nr:unnamed protein product [Mytilus coruscus]